MGRSNVRVVVRARPSATFASDMFSFDESAERIELRRPKDQAMGITNNSRESWPFDVDKVLSNASQEQVFENCGADVVRSVMDGYNGTIMAYGQTGAGKTHTMTGGHVGFGDRGIVPRAISLIYAEKAARSENNISVRLSYAEIYNELTFDLLTDIGVSEQSGNLAIVEDARGKIQVRGLSMQPAASEEEALHIFFQGDTNRHVAEHALNKGSTRSHCVFSIHVESRSRVESTEKVISSKLHLVDLAGSERVKKTGTDGQMLKEATYINKSLTFLEQVVVALESKHRDHVPYRQSKLTHMLKDSLGGNCKTTMVANIWPEANKFEETASTLGFATRMMKVSNQATINVHLDPQLLIRKYERQIKELKQELDMHDTLAGRSRVQYEWTPDEQKDLESKVNKYLIGDIQEIDVTSLRMVHEAFAVFRNKHNELQTKLAERPFAAAADGGAADPDSGLAAAPDATAPSGDLVGEDEEGRGISVGMAPSGSRPAQEDRGQGDGGDTDMMGRPGDMRGSTQGAAGDDERPPDKQVAFADWKAREGQAFEEAFNNKRLELKERRQEMKDAMTNANNRKREIDEAKERLGKKQASKESEGGRDEELIDEEEYALIKSLKETKQAYRDSFERHRLVKMDVIQIEHFMQQCKTKLVQAFEDWFDQRYGHLLKAEQTMAAREAEGERYDPQEQFDRMQAERLEAQHPDALAYTRARKNAARAVRRR